MIQDILAIGDKIELKLSDNTGRIVNDNKLFVSQFIDFIEEDIISIATPIVYGKSMYLAIGSRYHLCFYSNKSLYECNCEVVGHFKDNNLEIVYVRLQSELEKFQRREYYRLECVMDAKYRIITEDEIRLDEKKRDAMLSDAVKEQITQKLNELTSTWILATVTDISGGGARFNSNNSIEIGKKVMLQVDLSFKDDSKRLAIEAKVVASKSLENKIGLYEHRIQYVAIGKRDREDIIKYIFEQDRRRRKYDRV